MRYNRYGSIDSLSIDGVISHLSIRDGEIKIANMPIFEHIKFLILP